MSKAKYYPHNWAAVSNMDESILQIMSEHWTVQDVIEEKMSGYELPSSIFCMIRSSNQSNGKIKEFVYQRKHAANNKLRSLLESDDPIEVLLLTEDSYVVLQNSAYTPHSF